MKAPVRASVAGFGRVMVDGRLNPDVISDATAASMLLPMLAPSQERSLHEKRRGALLTNAGFSEQDLIVLKDVLAPLHRQIDEWRRQMNAARSLERRSDFAPAAEPSAPNLETPAAPEAAAFARLQRELSPDGIVRLRRQLTYIKSNTKILPVVSDSSRRPR